MTNDTDQLHNSSERKLFFRVYFLYSSSLFNELYVGRSILRATNKVIGQSGCVVPSCIDLQLYSKLYSEAKRRRNKKNSSHGLRKIGSIPSDPYRTLKTSCQNFW